MFTVGDQFKCNPIIINFQNDDDDDEIKHDLCDYKGNFYNFLLPCAYMVAHFNGIRMKLKLLDDEDDKNEDADVQRECELILTH